ncbi:MAG TPA: DUF72 domain-containing protein [Gemmatimonadaceae bacterium]|nr:DUF72 domain-containing protein [Gemmatimonadaceae bacterium]
MNLKLGMCGFTIGAATYYRQFKVVEVQQTFYDPPMNSTLERWRRQAPDDFEFTMKAWQVITHFGTSRTYRRLKSPFTDEQRAEAGGFRLTETVMRAWERTLECARILSATAILFQCPASFKATEENTAAMRKFFSTIARPRGITLLWEPRGPWPDEVVLSLCRELGLIHTVDPFVRPSLTPELIYWRLHGNVSHYARYSDDELQQIRDWIPGGDGDAYVMFNNVPRIHDVRRFRELGFDQS